MRYYKFCTVTKLTKSRKLLLLTVTTVKNVWFGIIRFLITNSNFKNLYEMFLQGKELI